MLDLMKVKTECAICPIKIWHKEGERLKKTAEYNELDVKLDDLSIMTVGVCSKHTKPKKTELLLMTGKIHQGWLEEVAFGIGDEDWVKDKGLSLKIVGVI